MTDFSFIMSYLCNWGVLLLVKHLYVIFQTDCRQWWRLHQQVSRGKPPSLLQTWCQACALQCGQGLRTPGRSGSEPLAGHALHIFAFLCLFIWGLAHRWPSGLFKGGGRETLKILTLLWLVPSTFHSQPSPLHLLPRCQGLFQQWADPDIWPDSPLGCCPLGKWNRGRRRFLCFIRDLLFPHSN